MKPYHSPMINAKSVIPATIILSVLLIGCSAHQPPRIRWDGDPTAAAFLDSLAARSTAADAMRASLFLTFEGGFLEEDQLRIHGQMAQVWPGRFRLIGQYGAFRKVFDLRVRDADFQIYDHREHVLYRGDAFDPDATYELGFALRPGDLGRLLRLGGLGPLQGGSVSAFAADGDTIRATVSIPGDEADWHSTYEAESLLLIRLERELDDLTTLRVTYDRYSRQGKRWVPGRIVVSRPTGDERVEIDVRQLRFEGEIQDSLFEFQMPEGAEVVDLGHFGEKPIEALHPNG